MKKRKDGRYCKQVLLGYKPDGKPKYKNIYGTTKADVEQRAALFKSDLEKGIAIVEDDIKLTDWAEKWLELYKNNVAYNTLTMYKLAINKYIIPCLGHLKLKDIKKHHVQEMINGIIKNEKQRMAEQVKLTINQILNQALENEYIYKNVASNISLPKKEKTAKRSLSSSEIELIEKANLTLKEKTYLYLLLYSGVRRGESLALTKNDINLDTNKLIINKTVIHKINQAEIKPAPKSEAGNREIPILKPLKDLFSEYLKNINSIYIFPMTNGAIMTKTSFKRFWEGIMEKLNTAAGGYNWKRQREKPYLIALSSDITPHMFRHTYATMLYNADVDIKTAQYLLGHSTVQMTLDIYTHLDNKKIAQSENKLNDFLAGTTKSKSVKNQSINE